MDDRGLMFFQTVQQEEEFCDEVKFEIARRAEMDAQDIAEEIHKETK